MKIICISGHCGSGKSEVAKIFAKKLPNSTLISADEFMFRWMGENPQQFKEAFGISQEIKDQDEYMCQARDKMNAEHFIAFIRACSNFVGEEIEKTLNNIKVSKYLFAIIEWLGLPQFKVWERADYNIIVNAEYELRKQRLRNRTKKEGGGYRKNPAEVRTPVVENILQNPIRIDFTINNNYNEYELLEADVQRLCDEIIKANYMEG
jgi:dephospho-CoA kinase